MSQVERGVQEITGKGSFLGSSVLFACECLYVGLG